MFDYRGDKESNTELDTLRENGKGKTRRARCWIHVSNRKSDFSRFFIPAPIAQQRMPMQLLRKWPAKRE